MSASIVTDHGLEVVLPGYHRAVIFTANDEDATTIAAMVRSCGCVATPLSPAFRASEVPEQREASG
ncbi:hypothetical protein ACVBEQ_10250 [Nakamurella sp. GG22]